MIRHVDDLILLTQVIEAGSFTAASAITGLPKSLLSRRIAELKSELGVRLIERTTRSFRVTGVGENFYRHGLTIRSERDAALAVVDNVLVHPSGGLSVVCPVVLAEQLIGEIAVEFASRYPLVQLKFDVVNGMPNMHPEYYDIVFLPSYGDLSDTEMIARQLMTTPYELVAARRWIKEAGFPKTIDRLNGLEGVGWWQSDSRPVWHLNDRAGKRHEVVIKHSLQTNNLVIAKAAAIAGLGMARLPLPLCERELSAERLQRVIPGVKPDPIRIYVAYPSRKSLRRLAGHSLLFSTRGQRQSGHLGKFPVSQSASRRQQNVETGRGTSSVATGQPVFAMAGKRLV